MEALNRSRLAPASCILAVPILLVRPYVGVTYIYMMIECITVTMLELYDEVFKCCDICLAHALECHDSALEVLYLRR